MKLNFTLLFCFLCITILSSQERYLTKNGKITFFSSATIENISAENNQVLSIVDASNGKMAISILMKSFQFEKALMQEHFNENYVESDKFPKATFKGEILNFSAIKDSTRVIVKGMLTVHGVSKEISIESTINKVENAILMNGEFFINLSDFDIKIPSIVKRNIAKKIKVNFNFNHTPYKR